MNTTVLILSGFIITLYAFTSVQTMFRFQNKLWETYDMQSTSEQPCQQTISDWLNSDQTCLPPLGDYRHNRYLPAALCYAVQDQSLIEGAMQCPGL